MKNILIIGAGGFLGATLRYVMSGFFHKIFSATLLPVGTLGVNLLGCLIIGFLGGWSENLQVFSTEQRSFIFLGLLGSFTTFSTFGYETLALLRDHETVFAFMNVLIHIFMGLFAVWFGYSLTTI
jgi:CrcB protein